MFLDKRRGVALFRCYGFDTAYLQLDTEFVVVAFSSLARILGECAIIHSPPALFKDFYGD